MNVSDIKTSIKSYEKRLEGRKEDAIAAIKEGSLWAAQIAINEASGFEAVIDELEFQLECMEADND